MLTLKIAEENDFRKIAQLISSLNHKTEERCLHCGVNEQEVFVEMMDHHSRLELRFVVAYVDEKLIAALGCDCDANFERIWFWGPFIQREFGESWEDIASQLYNFFFQKTPNIKQLYAYKHLNNQRARTFFQKKGFKEAPNEIYEYSAAAKGTYSPTPLSNLQTIRYKETYFDDLNFLHNTFFPETYYSTKELIELDSKNNRIYLVITPDNQAVAYVVATKRVTNDGYIHFLGVSEIHRRKGIGKHLLLTALHWLFEEENMPEVKLTVSSANNARKLYESVGFSLLHAGIGSKLVL